MRVLTPAAVSAIILLAGCSKPAPGRDGAGTAAPATEAAKSDYAPADASADPAKKPAQPAPAGAMLAYDYAYGIQAPPRRIAELQARHQGACAAAGPALCQVTGSTLETQGKDNVHATLALRAAPAWLAKFRDQIAGDAKAAGGRLTQANVTSEDLSRQVTDTAAAIRAKTALRDRLQAILETRAAKTADLVELETALAKVQGELDATQSEMAVMRQRLDTSVLTIDYVSADVLAPEGVLAPLASAFGRFAETFVGALALIIGVVAFILPWALVIGAGVWLFRGPLRKIRLPGRRRPGAPET
jgi:hypothetical protein